MRRLMRTVPAAARAMREEDAVRDAREECAQPAAHIMRSASVVLRARGVYDHMRDMRVSSAAAICALRGGAGDA